MRLINESSRSTSHLQTLIEFVSAYVPEADQVILGLSDHCEVGKMTQGLTARESPGRPILVTMGLSHNLPYPHTTRHVPALPAVRVTSWEEEFVLVLAHELRHAAQIAHRSYLKSEWYDAEVDAERFAYSVLDAFQRALAMAA